jgi:hypothetical protein
MLPTLGNRYVGSSSSALVDVGSRTASAAGLTNYTILPSEVPDTNNVDIGFHYKVEVIRPYFSQQSLATNDDNEYIDNLFANICFSINFFGATYSTLYVNNNGNVTFQNSLPVYVPGSLVDEATNQELDIIAPFWADVDTRNTNSALVTYGVGTVNGYAAFAANWVNVGYYNMHADKLNSFQLVLIDRSDIATGDFDMEFNYAQIKWEEGDASDGQNGFSGTNTSPARAGYANASGSTFEFNGSGIAHGLLDTNLTTGLIYSSFNSAVPGRYVFQFRNGTPLANP